MIKCFSLSLLLLLVPACSNELKGDLILDGQAFELSSCRSGAIYGFVGVELVSKQGAKLRFAQTPTGEAVAFHIPDGESTGVEIGMCGSFSVSQQNSTINDVKNVEGKGQMDCSAAGHTLKGSFKFSNCH